MTDKFRPIEIDVLLKKLLQQYNKGQVLGINKELFFKPNEIDKFKTIRFGKQIDTAIGVAAGPHTQLAQNIIVSWLMGARYIELKTIQTLDNIEISKPCIDMQDEGYNCEWSQELTIEQSFNEYLNAWIIIHIFNDILFDKQKDIACVFNMSVGYNLEGILQDNVQWFLKKMSNCKKEIKKKIKLISKIYPKVKKLNIPSTISDNVTLSTMHGCPPNEIRDIAKYLIENKGLHTIIKLNPTLVGNKKLNEILKLSGFKTNVPDIAFEHDLKYNDAIDIIKSLSKIAKKNKLFFGLKLSNTLESTNNKQIFSKDNSMMYMSGRALHSITVLLAKKILNEFDGNIDLSFSGGADAFNTHKLLMNGMTTVTVCSDLLKPGGYTRLYQYIEELRKHYKPISNKKQILENINKYANEVLEDKKYKQIYFETQRIKTNKKLEYFDCISSTCTISCPTNQDVPQYMYHTANGDFEKAYDVIMNTNPFPSVTGMACDHICQTKCTRINYDESLKIREIKRFIAEQGIKKDVYLKDKNGKKAAIIGAGPSGLSAAHYLIKAGFEVNIYEISNKPGGMLSAVIPSFRLNIDAVNNDIQKIIDLGVKIHYMEKVNNAKFNNLREKNDYVYIAVGAQIAREFLLEGSESLNIHNPLEFLKNVKKNIIPQLGKKVVVIGGGNTAFDVARTAKRIVGETGSVKILYRRTKEQMPAGFSEIKEAIDEGVDINELLNPIYIKTLNNRAKKLVLSKMKLGSVDSSGRARPEKIKNSEFEIELDTIIPAVGQDINIDFLDNKLIKKIKPNYETQIENVFIGGDALRGGSTIINAVGDGRKVAESIINAEKIKINKYNKASKNIEISKIKEKKAIRVFSEKIINSNKENKKPFELMSDTLSKEDAIKEASRCLYCDEICDICVTVCPNFANQSYTTEPVKYKLQKAISNAYSTIFVEDKLFEINQTYQIINIANWCNECGNCDTFCPTNNAPYKVKPKLHLTKKDFDLFLNGYFIDKIDNNRRISYKNNNIIHTLISDNDIYVYETKNIIAKINKSDFRLIKVKIADKSINEMTFEKAAEMSILLNFKF